MAGSEKIPSFFGVDGFGRTVARVRGLEAAQRQAQEFAEALP